MNGITLYQNGLGIDGKLRSKSGNTFRYFLTDHLGSTVALTDSSGTIVSSTTYDSFGNAAPKQATGSAASGTGNAASSAGKATPNIAASYRYTGREYDADTGLYYYRNRWYDPEIGRFISEDPIGFAGGDINLYGYVWNNPQSWTDPSGNSACDSQKRKRQRIPCPPTLSDVIEGNKWNSKGWFKDVSNRVLAQASKHDKDRVDSGRYKEVGGWFLMNPRGSRVTAVIKKSEPEPIDTSVQIRLGEPEKHVGGLMKKGWRVIGTFHSHADDFGPSGEIEFLSDGGVKASGDHRTNWSQRVPGLVLTRPSASKGKKNEIKYWIYGPKRGYFGKGLPMHCR